MSEAAPAESGGSGEHAVTPLELFFDLVFVFAITQVTALLTSDPSWHGVIRGALTLAAVWWAWTGYAWLTSTLNVDEGGVRLLMLTASAAMLGLALALPQAFGDDAILFGLASSPCGSSTWGCTRTPAKTTPTSYVPSSASHRPKRSERFSS
jgi:low temperature requirement protein LtrA